MIWPADHALFTVTTDTSKSDFITFCNTMCEMKFRLTIFAKLEINKNPPESLLHWLIWQVDNADSQPKSLLWSEINTQPHPKQMSKYWQIFKLKIWRYCSSFATENSFKRFRTLKTLIRKVFWGQKMDPHRDQKIKVGWLCCQIPQNW